MSISLRPYAWLESFSTKDVWYVDRGFLPWTCFHLTCTYATTLGQCCWSQEESKRHTAKNPQFSHLNPDWDRLSPSRLTEMHVSPPIILDLSTWSQSPSVDFVPTLLMDAQVKISIVIFQPLSLKVMWCTEIVNRSKIWYCKLGYRYKKNLYHLWLSLEPHHGWMLKKW